MGKKNLVIGLVLFIVSVAMVHADAVVVGVPANDGELLVQESDMGVLLIQLGLLADQRGQSDLADRLFETAIARAETDRARAVAIHNRGVLAYEDDDLESAKEYFEEAVEEDETYGLGWYHLGLLQYHLHEYADSMESIGTYIDLDDAPAGWFDLGIVTVEFVRFGGGDPLLLHDAETYFGAAADKDPNFPHARQNQQVVQAVIADIYAQLPQ